MPTYLPAQWENHKVYLEPTDWRRRCKCLRRIPYYVGEKIKVSLVVEGENAKGIIEQIPIFENMPKFGVEDDYYRCIDLKYAQVRGNNKKAYLELETCIIERPGNIRYGIEKADIIDTKLPLSTITGNLLILTAETSEQKLYKQINHILPLIAAIIGASVGAIITYVLLGIG